jgi:transcriptional regulator with XRE-family HTH domain
MDLSSTMKDRMAEGDSPTVARRRVRLALREAREAAELTQLQVAEEMERSLSKVIRIENGDVSIAPNDLRVLLGYLGIKDRTTAASLLADTKIARTRQRRTWWQEPNFREHLSEELRRFIEYEAEASAIRWFSVLYVPGALQTPEYANALTGRWSDEGELSADKVAALVEARRLRHEALLARLGTVDLSAILDQSALMRPIGGDTIFIAQLRQLQDVAARGLVKIRMLPFDIDVPIANNASFDLLSIGPDGDEVMYRENGMTDEMVEDKAETERHRRRFEQLWRAANTEDDTIEFIKSRMKDLEQRAADRQA